MQRAGAGPRLVFSKTGCAVGAFGAAFDPAAPFLAVVSYDSCLAHYDNESGVPELTLMRPDGADKRVVAVVPDISPSLDMYSLEGPWFGPGGGVLAWAFPVTQNHTGQRSESAIELINPRTGRQMRVISVASRMPMLPVRAPAQALPIAFSPDGRQLALVAPGAPAISIVGVASGKLQRTIRTPGGAASGVAWSTAGRLAFAAANDSIYVVSAGGAGLRRVTQPPAGNFQNPPLDLAPEWSPDGSRLLFVREVGGPPCYDSGCGASFTGVVEVVAASGGRPVRVSPATAGSAFNAVWSPDGREIAFGAVNGVYVVGATGGKPRRIAGRNFQLADWQSSR
jgi:Tol biopolymer transport system component